VSTGLGSSPGMVSENQGSLEERRPSKREVEVVEEAQA
jgi:hypothetical protein